jgi:hypothetical protein
MGDSSQTALVSARVSASETKSASVFVRSHRFEVGEALSFDAADPRLSAVEYFLGALAADLVGGFKRLAARRRLEVYEVEAVVEGIVAHPLVHLGVIGEEGEPHLASIALKVYASTFADRQAVENAWAEAMRRSPLATTFRKCLTIQIHFQIAS